MRAESKSYIIMMAVRKYTILVCSLVWEVAQCSQCQLQRPFQLLPPPESPAVFSHMTPPSDPERGEREREREREGGGEGEGAVEMYHFPQEKSNYCL